MKKHSSKSVIQASFNTIRVGKRYKLINYGETTVFEVLEIIDDNDCIVKTIDTMETFHLNDLVKFGKGSDFDFDSL